MWKTRDVSMCDFFVLKYFQNFKYRGDKRVVFFFFFLFFFMKTTGGSKHSVGVLSSRDHGSTCSLEGHQNINETQNSIH
jgi:hypothetical protein